MTQSLFHPTDEFVYSYIPNISNTHNIHKIFKYQSPE